jgi:hypothetical protein
MEGMEVPVCGNRIDLASASQCSPSRSANGSVQPAVPDLRAVIGPGPPLVLTNIALADVRADSAGAASRQPYGLVSDLDQSCAESCPPCGGGDGVGFGVRP